MRLDDLPESGNIEDRRGEGGVGGAAPSSKRAPEAARTCFSSTVSPPASNRMASPPCPRLVTRPPQRLIFVYHRAEQTRLHQYTFRAILSQ